MTRREKMTIKIAKIGNQTRLIGRVQEMAGVDLSLCYQCRKCTAGCPVSGLAGMTPAELIRRLQLGAGDEILESDLVWLCLSCETCYTRCPMRINAAAVMDALRALAVEKGAREPAGKISLFNKLFLNSVRRYGRSYDFQALAAYKLGSGNVAGDLAKLPAMLAKGKMAVLPPSGGDKQAVRRIFQKTKGEGGAGK
jgi:heterodisulfide reductase subunit C